MPTETYVIGPGVKQAMQDASDEPRSSEQYFHNEDGSLAYSQTYGRDGVYVYYPTDNQVRRLPFDAA